MFIYLKERKKMFNLDTCWGVRCNEDKCAISIAHGEIVVTYIKVINAKALEKLWSDLTISIMRGEGCFVIHNDMALINEVEITTK